MVTGLEIIDGIELTTSAKTAYSSLHDENQRAIASKLQEIKKNLANFISNGEVTEITFSQNPQTYTFDYKYLKLIFCLDSQGEIELLDIINKTWWQNQDTNNSAKAAS